MRIVSAATARGFVYVNQKLGRTNLHGTAMSKEWQKEDYQNCIEVDAETKESTRKTEEKLAGRYKEGHERKKPK